MPDQTHLSEPPVAPRRPVKSTHHGRDRVDDYEWLRDKESPEVHRATSRPRTPTPRSGPPTWPTCARRSSTRSRPAPWRPTCRCRPATAATGTTARSFEGREYGASCRVPVADDDDWTPPQPAEDCAPDQPALPGEQVLLDLNALAEGHEFFSLGGSAVSPDGHLLAYSTDIIGDERYTVRVKDLTHRRAAARRDHRRPRRRHLGPATAATSTTRPSTTPGAPTRSGGTGSAPRRPTTSWSTTRPTAGSGSASAAPAATGSW